MLEVYPGDTYNDLAIAEIDFSMAGKPTQLSLAPGGHLFQSRREPTVARHPTGSSASSRTTTAT